MNDPRFAASYQSAITNGWFTPTPVRDLIRQHALDNGAGVANIKHLVHHPPVPITADTGVVEVASTGSPIVPGLIGASLGATAASVGIAALRKYKQKKKAKELQSMIDSAAKQ